MTLPVLLFGILVGSFPTGVVVSRLLTGQDVRDLGSGNIGAANVARTAGLKVGALVAAIDILKGMVPVLVGLGVGLEPWGLALVAIAAVIGHDFSIFLHFRGGKGVATTLGALLVLTPVVTAIALVIWVATMLIWRYSSLASLTALAALPLLAWLAHSQSAYVVCALVLFVLAAVKHWENILRLSQGRERKFGRTRPADGG